MIALRCDTVVYYYYCENVQICSQDMNKVYGDSFKYFYTKCLLSEICDIKPKVERNKNTCE